MSSVINLTLTDGENRRKIGDSHLKIGDSHLFWKIAENRGQPPI